ncbi:MAG: hypothetical protein M3162_09050, partial [Thermoproteota archaeon]|nr:hypothetical protein [Thermoproteota archaeon]
GYHSSHSFADLGDNTLDSLKDKSHYYNALETSKRMIEIYEKDLDSADTSLQDRSPLSILKKSLYELNENIGNYSKPSNIMEIVHVKVHPNLQLAFNLTLKQ